MHIVLQNNFLRKQWEGGEKEAGRQAETRPKRYACYHTTSVYLEL